MAIVTQAAAATALVGEPSSPDFTALVNASTPPAGETQAKTKSCARAFLDMIGSFFTTLRNLVCYRSTNAPTTVTTDLSEPLSPDVVSEGVSNDTATSGSATKTQSFWSRFCSCFSRTPGEWDCAGKLVDLSKFQQQ